VSNAEIHRRIFSLMDEQHAMSYAAFSDGRHTIHEIYESGDHVFARGSFSGTHTGDFMGMPPTGKEISVTEMNFDRFADGKLVEHGAEADMVGLMQLGAIPALTAT